MLPREPRFEASLDLSVPRGYVGERSPARVVLGGGLPPRGTRRAGQALAGRVENPTVDPTEGPHGKADRIAGRHDEAQCLATPPLPLGREIDPFAGGESGDAEVTVLATDRGRRTSRNPPHPVWFVLVDNPDLGTRQGRTPSINHHSFDGDPGHHADGPQVDDST